MKRITCLAAWAVLGLLLCGCQPAEPAVPQDQSGAASVSTPAEPEQNRIPFEEGQLYAAAYLGYQEMESLEDYLEEYTDRETVPVHYLSEGEFYLIIPRYEDMELTLLENNMETMEARRIYEEANCGPFVVQCNVSDIFSDVTIQLRHQGEQTEFSPYISLKDGSVEIGESGLNLTKPQA